MGASAGSSAAAALAGDEMSSIIRGVSVRGILDKRLKNAAAIEVHNDAVK